jgi:hypothetical protein
MSSQAVRNLKNGGKAVQKTWGKGLAHHPAFHNQTSFQGIPWEQWRYSFPTPIPDSL